MAKSFYIQFPDFPNSVKVSFDEYSAVYQISERYNSFLSTVPHRFGTTLYVSFTSVFYRCNLIYDYNIKPSF